MIHFIYLSFAPLIFSNTIQRSKLDNFLRKNYTDAIEKQNDLS
jgi:hypothetical protein